MKRLILIGMMAAASALPHAARAGEKGGNGGDVLVCEREDGATYELLDLYQGREDWKLPPRPVSGATYVAVLHDLLRELRKTDLRAAVQYYTRGMQIFDAIGWLERDSANTSPLVRFTSKALVDIPDEGLVDLPPECRKVQAAAQLPHPFAGEPKFVFQSDIWSRLDLRARVSLVLHEVIYETLIAEGAEDSRSTRYLNAAIHGWGVSKVRDYLNVSREIGYVNIVVPKESPLFFGPRERSCGILDMRGTDMRFIRAFGGNEILWAGDDKSAAIEKVAAFAARGYCD